MTVGLRVVWIIFFWGLLAACGRKGALLYPDMLIPSVSTGVSVRQSGASLRLQFVLPVKDRAGRSVQKLSGVKIIRRVSEHSEVQSCRQGMTEYVLFKTLYLDVLSPEYQRFGSLLVSIDTDVTAGRSYSYGILPFTSDGVDGALTVTSDINVVAAIAAPLVVAQSLPTEIQLQITPVLSPAVRFIGYNIYRGRNGDSLSYQPLNNEPFTGNLYVDAGLERNVTYRYAVRQLVYQEAAGGVIESDESGEVIGMLADE